MKALVVRPAQPSSIHLAEIDEPDPRDGDTLVRALALGVCGTDIDIVRGEYGEAPSGRDRLVIGHESLGVIEHAPRGSRLSVGDHVVPFVREPDPVPCDCCAAGAWDRCRNGRFTEHGIKGLDGFGRERYRVASARLIGVDKSLGLTAVLIEPASIVAKAWEEVERLLQGACWQPRRVLVTGAGPVGLLAALMGVQRQLEVHLFDRATDGAKPELARAIGASYHSGELANLAADFDVVLECTGAPSVVIGVANQTSPGAVICLLGVTGERGEEQAEVGTFNDRLVLGNRIVFGSVNAGRRHYEAAATALSRTPRRWLEQMITRRVPLARAAEGFTKDKGGVKTVIVFGEIK
jgi:glucose 1-dehydrogenase